MSAQILGFRCRVVRIEAVTHVPEEANEVRWELTVAEPESPDRVHVMGRMVATANGNWGQVIVLGELRVSPDREPQPVVEFLDSYAKGFTDEMLTTARRALATNAVLLDIDFLLPLEPPGLSWADSTAVRLLPDTLPVG
ncbi:MAG: hypothetical protein Q4D79_10590 [Propionibacteriaceae bacterium]|nr:hypothetical protein [Propionibacteriaceae bacterium]